MKIAFIGDIHLDSQTPISRIDNYRETTLKKLNSLLSLCIESDIDVIISTGDFFDKYDQPIAYLIEVVAVLAKFKQHSIKFYTLIGNHDLPYNNMEYFKNTPLNLLVKAGVVELFDVLEFDHLNIFGLHFTETLDKFKNFSKEKKSFLIMHYASENTVPGESIELKNLTNFDVVIAGHDHMPYDPIKKYNTVLIRPGSFTRRTKEVYNLSRDNILIYTYDTKSKDFAVLHLPNVVPAKNIFKNESFVESGINLYSNKYNDLFNESYFNSKAQDIFQILDSLPILVTQESKNEIINFLKKQGLERITYE